MATVINIRTKIWGVMAVGDYTITRAWTPVDLDDLSLYSMKSLCGDYRLERIEVSNLAAFQAACQNAESNSNGGVTPPVIVGEYRSVLHDFNGPLTINEQNVLALITNIGETGTVVQIHLLNKGGNVITVSPDTNFPAQSFTLESTGEARGWGDEDLTESIAPFSVTIPADGKLAVSATIYIT